MAVSVGIRELRQNLSVYIKRVRSGEALQVTEYGRPVAMLAPLAELADPIARLDAEGLVVRRARGNLADLAPALEPPPGAKPLSVVLDELREDRP